jgi:hypothetical protein
MTIDKEPKARPNEEKATPPPMDAKAGGASKAKMLKAVGASEEDVLSYNSEAQTLVTQQGGKYRLTADGKTLQHLAGPAPTGGKKEDEDDEG